MPGGELVPLSLVLLVLLARKIVVASRRFLEVLGLEQWNRGRLFRIEVFLLGGHLVQVTVGIVDLFRELRFLDVLENLVDVDLVEVEFQHEGDQLHLPVALLNLEQLQHTLLDGEKLLKDF